MEKRRTTLEQVGISNSAQNKLLRRLSLCQVRIFTCDLGAFNLVVSSMIHPSPAAEYHVFITR